MKQSTCILVSGLIGSFIFLSCNLEEIPPLDPPISKFQVENDSCLVICTLNFTNNSENGSSFLWDFGDGTSLDTNRNPSHEYQDPGVFRVRLISRLKNVSDTAEQEVTILPGNFNKPTANFLINNDSCKAPCPIDFLNQSLKGDTYLWDFGDGTTSSDPNPTHIYEKPGSYTVTLIVYGSGLIDTSFQTVTINAIIFVRLYNTVLGPANDVIQLDDRGYAIVGNGNFVARIAKDGTSDWEKAPGPIIAHFDALIQDQDGNLVIIENTRDTANFTYSPSAIVKYTIHGGPIYNHDFIPITSSQRVFVSDIALSNEGDYFIVGGYDPNPYNSPTPDARIVLIQYASNSSGQRFDTYYSNGFSAYGGEIYNHPEFGISYFGYVFNTSVPTKTTHLYTINPMDTIRYNLSKHINRFAPTKDGNYITLVGAPYSLMLWKLGLPGDWSLGVSIPINDNNYDRIEGMKIIERSDTKGGYAGVANVYLENANPINARKNSGLFFITDSDGMIEHSEIIGQPHTYDGLHALIQTSDCGYALTGMLDGNPVLIKTDAQGKFQ